MSTEQDKPADSIDDWIRFEDAYLDFVNSHPMLGLSVGEFAAINLRRNFAEPLIATGTVRQLVNRKWLAHREHFGPALFKLLTLTPEDAIAKARERQRR